MIIKRVFIHLFDGKTGRYQFFLRLAERYFKFVGRADRQVRAVVLHGEGRAFCAGVDMARFAEMGSGQIGGTLGNILERTHGLANGPQQVAWGWRELPLPVIAAVHGVAYGGGFQLMLGAELRFVAPDTKLSIMEINWGLVPDGGIALLRGLLRDDLARVPLRSPDDFLHAANELRIGGIFLTHAGERIGCVRRKGKGVTLSRLNVETEQPDAALPLAAGLEQELTGGMERGEFEAMFGLNHARLREGGKILLRGEGDVGVCLKPAREQAE